MKTNNTIDSSPSGKTIPPPCKNGGVRRHFLKSLLGLFALLFALNGTVAEAKQNVTLLNVVPTVTSLTISNGQLLAGGTVSAVVNGTSYSSLFSNVPVNLTLATNQTGAGACPILDLELAPITLNLLGLVVETSPICLKITAYAGGGLLGDLLCSVANLLNRGLTLPQILNGQGVTGAVPIAGLTPTQITGLLGGITNLLNEALGNLLDSVLQAVTELRGRACGVLHLELGPVNLTLLGLEVILDDCDNGPVTVDISAVRGGILGNLLCQLLGRGQLPLLATLENILGEILN